MQPHEKLYAKRLRRAFGGSVEGQGTARRLDRKASGGSIKERFNAAVHDQPARPTINEPNAVNAVHLLKRGGRADPWGDEHEDKAADAAMIKSAIRQHETAEHGGEHRPIKLARGGEARDYDKGWVEGQPAKGGGRARRASGGSAGDDYPGQDADAQAALKDQARQQEEDEASIARARSQSKNSFSAGSGRTMYLDDGKARGGAPKFRTASGSVSAAARHSAEKHGDAMPGGRFPIRNASDLSNAKHAFGRANDKPAVRRWIDKRARELGKPPMGES